MTRNIRYSLVALAVGANLAMTADASAAAPPNPVEVAKGVVRTPSAFGFDETIQRIKADIAGKGIRFFTEIDQSALARGAGIELRPSTLLIFGNPPLGAQFLTSNPYAGLDWPVRILVIQDAADKVWVAYTDFRYIGERYAIRDRSTQIKTASDVAGSIASSVADETPRAPNSD